MRRRRDPLASLEFLDVNGTRIAQQTATAIVPEPATTALSALGLVGLAAAGARRPRRPTW